MGSKRQIDLMREDRLANPGKYYPGTIRRGPEPTGIKVDTSTPEGYRRYMREYQRQRRATPQGRYMQMRDSLWMVHGIGIEFYRRQWELQRGKCALCGAGIVLSYDPETPKSSRRGPIKGGAHVDHDHACCEGRKSCGECFRGLLCGKCNTGLACFRDDPQLLTKAIEYLKLPRRPSTKQRQQRERVAREEV